MNKLTYIDDRQLDHFILKKFLSRYGSSYDVKCTSSAVDVLSLLIHYKYEKDMLPDIILVDVYMPAFDGWDFLEQLQLLYPTLNKRIEVYILSAFKYPEDVQRATKYPFVKAYILKPITKEVLLRLIEHKKMALPNFETIGYAN